MARQISIFHFTGSLGNVVGYCKNGEYFVRSKPRPSNKPATITQMAHRAKFALASQFTKNLQSLLRFSITGIKSMTECNFVTAQVMKQAIFGGYPNFTIDYSLVQVSRGRLSPPCNITAVAHMDGVLFNWQQPDHPSGNSNDSTILVAYCEALQQCIFMLNTTNRRAGVAILPLAAFQGHEVHTWVGFIATNGKDASNSVYTGRIAVS